MNTGVLQKSIPNPTVRSIDEVAAAIFATMATIISAALFLSSQGAHSFLHGKGQCGRLYSGCRPLRSPEFSPQKFIDGFVKCKPLSQPPEFT
ncbi:unnamed protein product [Victoria cruziana]